MGQRLAPDVGVVPHPRLGVDGLADRAEHPQRRQVVALDLLCPPLHEGTDGGGCGVELGDAVALDDVPQPILVPGVAVVADAQFFAGRVGGALVDDRGGAVGQRPVDDVAVAGDPTDVGGAPVDVGVGAQVEHDPVGERDLGQVAAAGVHDALGLGGGARGVEQVQQLLGVHRLGRAVRVAPWP